MDFLKAIFNDKPLTFDELVQAINAHNGNEANKENQIKIGNLGGGDYVSKAKHDALQALFDGKVTELDTANTLIADLKKGTKGNEELQGKVTAYETQVQQLQEQLKKTQLDSEIKVALLAAKAKDVEYMTYKLNEQGDKLVLGEDGKVKGIDEMIAGLKTQFPAHFEEDKPGRKIINNGRLPGNNTDPTTVTPEQFAKMGYNERLKLKQENEELFKQLAHM